MSRLGPWLALALVGSALAATWTSPRWEWEAAAPIAVFGWLAAVAATPGDRGWSWPRPSLGGLLLALPALALMVALRAAEPVRPDEIRLFAPGEVDAWDYWLGDTGLPSLVHTALMLPLRAAGGVEAALALHLAAVALSIGWLATLGRPAGAWTWPALAAVYWNADLLQQLQELRAYATMTLACTLAAVAVDRSPRPDRAVLVCIGAAALDVPACLVVGGAWLLGRMVWRAEGWRSVTVAGAAWALAQAPLLWATLAVQRDRDSTYGIEDAPLAVAALLGGLLAALGQRDGRGLVTLASVLAPASLVALGLLRSEPKYLLIAAPFALASLLAGLSRLPKARWLPWAALVGVAAGSAWTADGVLRVAADGWRQRAEAAARADEAPVCTSRQADLMALHTAWLGLHRRPGEGFAGPASTAVGARIGGVPVPRHTRAAIPDDPRCAAPDHLRLERRPPLAGCAVVWASSDDPAWTLSRCGGG